jgi:hypothetical protein
MNDVDEFFGETGPTRRKKSKKDPALDKVSPRGKPKRKKRVAKKKEPPPGEPVTESKPDTRDQLQAVKWFFEDIKAGLDKPIYIGIDPGSEGAIGFIHPDMPSRTTAVDMPVTKVEISKKTKKGNKAKRTVYDVGMLWEYFKIIKEWRHRVVVCIEKMQARPVDTALTAYSLGAAFHMWPLFLHSHEIVYEDIIPSDWKRRMGLIGKGKEASRFQAQKLFPAAPLSRKGDDGRAEALLIAEAIKRRRDSR